MIDPALNDDRTPPVPMTARPAYLCAARARRLWEESGGGDRTEEIWLRVPRASKTLLARSLWRLGGQTNF
jgi:hypothetical protein